MSDVVNLDDYDDLTCGEAPPPVRVLPGSYKALYRDYVVGKTPSGSARSQLRLEIVEVGEVSTAPSGLSVDDIGGEESLVGKSIFTEPVWFTSGNADYVARSTKRQAATLGIDYDSDIKGKSPKQIGEVYSNQIGEEFDVFVKWNTQTNQDGSLRVDSDGNPTYEIVGMKGRG